MKDELYINDKDAWLTWGASLEEGSDNRLLLSPPNKEFVENKSRSQPGKQVLPLNPQVDERDLQLVFNIAATDQKDWLTKYRRFTNEINKGLISFKVPHIETTYFFTTISYMELSFFDNIGRFTVKFNEPNPASRNFTYPIAIVLADKNNRPLIDRQNKVLTQKIK